MPEHPSTEAALAATATLAPLRAPHHAGPPDRPLRLAHLTTVDMSLSLLLATELRADVETGFTTFGISAPGPYVPQVEALGVTHVPIRSLTRSWDVRSDAAATRELVAALRSLHLDVLHTHNPKTGVLGRVLGRLLRIPVVVNTCHGLWFQADDPLPRKAFVLGSEAVAAQFSHAELYQNATDWQTLSRAVPGRRSRVVGNGVDLERFRPDPDGGRALRRSLGVRDDELLVMSVGRQVAEKGTAEFLAAARALADRARFVWVGPPDPAKPDAVALDDPAVTVLGSRDDMPAVYSAADVFVLPSYREGFSRSSMEAAACGAAMVLSDIRGCREIGTHGEHLLLVPVRDAAALTTAVRALLDDADLRQRLGHAARGRAHEAFDQRAVARVSMQTYAEVALRRGLPWTEGDTL